MAEFPVVAELVKLGPVVVVLAVIESITVGLPVGKDQVVLERTLDVYAVVHRATQEIEAGELSAVADTVMLELAQAELIVVELAPVDLTVDEDQYLLEHTLVAHAVVQLGLVKLRRRD